jgi:hypothetical protein
MSSDSALLLSQRVALLESGLAAIKESTWDLVIEVPSGPKDGVNRDFRLSRPPALLLLFFDGVCLREDADYERAGVLLKLYTAPATTTRLVAVMLCKSTLAEGVASQVGWYVGQTPTEPLGPPTTVPLSHGGTGHSSNTKGDLLVGTGSQWQKVLVGVNGQVLTADSSQTAGVRWATPRFGVCDGRLTVQSGTPVPMSDQNGTTVYFAPFTGDRIGLYNGSSWEILGFTELALPLSQNQAGVRTAGSAVLTGLLDTSQLAPGMKIDGPGIPPNTVISSIDSATQVTMNNTATSDGTDSYTFSVPPDKNVDIFAYSQGLSVKLEMRLWTNDTTRAAELVFQDGVLVRSGVPTRRYLGTVRTSLADGRVDDSATKRFVWNYYNRTARRLFTAPGYVDDGAVYSYTTTSTSFIPANGGVGARVEFVLGVQEAPVEVRLSQRAQNDTAGQNSWAGVGVDSTSSAVAATSVCSFTANLGFSSSLAYGFPAAPGYHHLNLLIRVDGGTGTWFADGPRGGSAMDPYATWLEAILVG